MKFQEFKEELIQRVKERNVRKEIIEELVKAKNLFQALGILKNYFSIHDLYEIISIDSLKEIDIDILYENKIFINESSDKGYIFCDSGEVTSSGTAVVFAFGNVRVKANEDSEVLAYDHAIIDAYDNTEVEACNDAIVTACHDSRVIASDRTYVISIRMLWHEIKDSAIMRHDGVIYFSKDLKFKQI